MRTVEPDVNLVSRTTETFVQSQRRTDFPDEHEVRNRQSYVDAGGDALEEEEHPAGQWHGGIAGEIRQSAMEKRLSMYGQSGVRHSDQERSRVSSYVEELHKLDRGSRGEPQVLDRGNRGEPQRRTTTQLGANEAEWVARDQGEELESNRQFLQRMVDKYWTPQVQQGNKEQSSSSCKWVPKSAEGGELESYNTPREEDGEGTPDSQGTGGTEEWSAEPDLWDEYQRAMGRPPPTWMKKAMPSMRAAKAVLDEINAEQGEPGFRNAKGGRGPLEESTADDNQEKGKKGYGKSGKGKSGGKGPSMDYLPQSGFDYHGYWVGLPDGYDDRALATKDNTVFVPIPIRGGRDLKFITARYEGFKGRIFFESDAIRVHQWYDMERHIDRPKSNRDRGPTVAWPTVEHCPTVEKFCDRIAIKLAGEFQCPGRKMVSTSDEQEQVRSVINAQSSKYQQELTGEYIHFRNPETLNWTNLLQALAQVVPTMLGDDTYYLDRFLNCKVPKGKDLRAALCAVRTSAHEAQLDFNTSKPFYFRMLQQKVGIPKALLDECRLSAGEEGRNIPIYMPTITEMINQLGLSKARSLQDPALDVFGDVKTEEPRRIGRPPHMTGGTLKTEDDDLLVFEVDLADENQQEVIDVEQDLVSAETAIDAMICGIETELWDMEDEELMAGVLNLKSIKSWQYNPRRRAAKGSGKGKSGGRTTFPGATNGEARLSSYAGLRKGKGKKGSSDATVPPKRGKGKGKRKFGAFEVDFGDELAVDYFDLDVFFAGLPMRFRCLRCGMCDHQAKDCKKEHGLCWDCGEVGHNRDSCPATDAVKGQWQERVKSSMEKVRGKKEMLKAMLTELQEELDCYEVEAEAMLVF